MGVQSRDDSVDSTVTVSFDGEWYVARDEETGVASQGETRAEALANLADAIELHERPDPEDADIGEPDAPWFE